MFMDTLKGVFGGAKAGKEKQTPAVDATARYEEAVTKDIDRIRESAKWLLATFGAVAGVLFAGLSLSDLGSVQDDELGLALAGALAAVVGVTVAIAAAGAVLVGGRVNLDSLRMPAKKGLREHLPTHRKRLCEEMATYKQLYGQYGTLDDLLNQSDEYWNAQIQALRDWHATKIPTKREAAMKRHEDAASGTDGLNPLLRRIRALANYQDMRLRFQVNSRWIILAALLTATGAAFFAVTVGQKADPKAQAAVPDMPVRAELRPLAAGEERLKSVFGDSCALEGLKLIALASSDTDWEVVTDPAAAGCDVARTTVAKDEGTVVSRAVVAVQPAP